MVILRGDEIMEVDVDGRPMRTHLFRPAVDDIFPGVVLFSEIYQVRGPICRLAARLRAETMLV